ncbi:protein [Lentinula edodes]|uniref:Protein n=1 Tax=Lentinula edodes TaxID=5353 RepID=A0A1Q3DWD5_LENED|nr:protein [Lentinula edodes]
MDWPVLCPSFRLSFSFILPPFTLLTLGVPCSSIDNGATAAAGSLDLLIVSASASAPSFNHLDPQFLTLLQEILNSQSIALSLLALRSQQLMDIMEVDKTSATSTNHVEIELDGQAGETEVIYPAEPQPTNSLVLPGEYKDGAIHAVYKDIDSLKRPALQALCKQYFLGTLGNKAILKQKLTRFSENRIHWQSLIHGARRSHRGVRDGGITKNNPKPQTGSIPSVSMVKKLKPSVIRRNELLGLPLNAPLGSQLFDTQRSKDTRTMEEKAALLRWAKEFRESYPFIPREEIARRRKAKEEEMAKGKATSTVMVAESIRSMNEQIASLTATIQMLAVGLPTLPPLPAEVLDKLTQITTPSGSFEHATITATSCGSISLNPQVSFSSPTSIPFLSPPFDTSINSNTLPVNGSANATLAVTPTNNVATTANRAGDERVHTLTIGHGQVLTYKYSHIHRVWDDERPSWDPIDCAKNLLEINGTAIALRYWQEVFSGKKNKVWSWLKKLWIEWKYVAECYRSRSPEHFWQDFSFSTGEHFHWKAITNQLRDLRSERDQQLVDKAKAEYGDRFSQVFVNNRGKVLTDRSAIARRYLGELHYCST